MPAVISNKSGNDPAIQRITQAGAQPVSWITVLCELQRDWARGTTAAGMVKISKKKGGSWSTAIAVKEFATKSH
ncbi:MAG: hypothetical protein ACAI35_01760 [Candidatus Methylacidiphilales bacterium]